MPPQPSRPDCRAGFSPPNARRGPFFCRGQTNGTRQARHLPRREKTQGVHVPASRGGAASCRGFNQGATWEGGCPQPPRRVGTRALPLAPEMAEETGAKRNARVRQVVARTKRGPAGGHGLQTLRYPQGGRLPELPRKGRTPAPYDTFIVGKEMLRAKRRAWNGKEPLPGVYAGKERMASGNRGKKRVDRGNGPG